MDNHFLMRSTLNCLAWAVACAIVALVTAPRPCAADDPKPAGDQSGIRRLVSKHLTLYTDLPPSDEVDVLPALFDQAFPQWCAYFGIDPTMHADWHVRGHLMTSRERFEAAGLLPPDAPDFTSGYARTNMLWCYDQTSEYYRRHLLLHEGTHVFMDALAGGLGPRWYAEGMAELLATHRLVDGQLTLNCFPRADDEVSKWGRIEIVRSDFAARRAMTLDRVFAYDPAIHGENRWYGWCWAAAAFLDRHPRYQSRFRQLQKLAGRPDFNDAVAAAFGGDWQRAQEDWQLFVANLDYGYDFSRADVEFVAGQPLPAEGASATVAADHSWQSSGVRLEAGRKYRLRASGRYQVADQPRVWWCEPGGVTIRYCDGRPLGMLLAAVRSDDGELSGASGLVKPFAVGLETTLTAPRDGTLYLRINDSAGSLHDNVGSLRVHVERE